MHAASEPVQHNYLDISQLPPGWRFVLQYALLNHLPSVLSRKPTMAEGNAFPALLLVATALLLALTTIAQTASTYITAYFAAPLEVTSIIDTVDFSIQENESYECDITKVTRLEDKLRLGRLLREIQRCGDDLREQLNGLLIDEGETRLGFGARVLWASWRPRIESQIQRLDMLRMRFLVVYMGLAAARTPLADGVSPRDSEKSAPRMTIRPSLPQAMTEAITKKPPPLRRLTTQAMGHSDAVGGGQKRGWAGVVEELQRSPMLHKRHVSVESGMNPP